MGAQPAGPARTIPLALLGEKPAEPQDNHPMTIDFASSRVLAKEDQAHPAARARRSDFGGAICSACTTNMTSEMSQRFGHPQLPMRTAPMRSSGRTVRLLPSRPCAPLEMGSDSRGSGCDRYTSSTRPRSARGASSVARPGGVARGMERHGFAISLRRHNPFTSRISST